MDRPRIRTLAFRIAAIALPTAFLSLARAAADRGPADTLDGLWLSDGYGLLAEIRGGTLKLFEITPYSCIASRTLTERAAPADARGRRFVTDGDASSVLFLSPGPSRDAEWFGAPDAASKILFRRTAASPPSCGRAASNDPPTNFEVFAWTFGAHHGFLAHRGVDWPAVVAANRPRVTASTNPAELFRILRGMIEPLHDAHTLLEAREIHEEFQGKKPGTRSMTDSEKRRTLEIVESRYLEDKTRSACRGHVRYGRLKGGPGYLRIDSFYDYADGGFDASASALDAALDDVLRDLDGMRGLVIDVRINRGGDDPLGVLIATRLAEKAYVAYVKRARNDASDPKSWTDPQTVTVEPSARPRFAGPVVELIGPDTVSAGETFTMALMGRSPRIVRIGESTQGVYSDVLIRALPNGWRFGLPNEVFLTEQGEHFEARGVPPDIRMDVFPKSDLAAERDGVLERAVELLRLGGAGAITNRD